MTAVTQRSRPSVPSSRADGGRALDDAPARPLVVSAVAGALALAACGLVVAVALAVLGWLASSGGTIGGAARVGLTAWLACHGAPPRIGTVQLGLVPLGAPVLVVLAARSTGRWARDSSAAVGDLARAYCAAAAGLTYGLVAAGLALVGPPAGVSVDPLRAGAFAGLLVAGGLVAGMGLGRTWAERAVERLPAVVVVAVHGAAAGLVAVLAASALTLLAAMTWHGSDALALGGRLEPGLVGGALLIVGCLLVLPNAVLWAAAYLLGPGFAVGTGSVVSPSVVTLGPLPAYPPLAALPGPGAQPVWLSGLLLLPIAAGAVAGGFAERRSPGGRRWWLTVSVGTAAGALAGLVLGLLLLLAGGSIGPGRLAEAGPALSAGLFAVGSLAVGGLVGAVSVRVHDLRPDRAWRVPRLSGRPRLPGRPWLEGLPRLRGLSRRSGRPWRRR